MTCIWAQSLRQSDKTTLGFATLTSYHHHRLLGNPSRLSLSLPLWARTAQMGSLCSLRQALVLSSSSMSLPASQTPAQAVLDPDLFAGVLSSIEPQSQLREEEVTDDLNGEGETLGSTVPGQSFEDGNLDENSRALRETYLIQAVNDVSKGVSERTHNEYQRHVLYPLAGHAHC